MNSIIIYKTITYIFKNVSSKWTFFNCQIPNYINQTLYHSHILNIWNKKLQNYWEQALYLTHGQSYLKDLDKN